jgi:predicted ATPase with chaperone activity
MPMLMPDTDTRRLLPHPSAPRTLEEAGLSKELLVQLVLKTLHFAGELTGTALADRLGLPFSVVEPALDLLKAMHHCEIAGGSLVGSASFRFRITDAGRVRAALFLDQNGYVGVAPVPIAQYQDYMRRFRAATPRTATPDRVRAAFGELVLSDRVLDQLGPALNAQHSIFIYGPSGNGKSLMTQRIRQLLDGDIAIPYALDIEGEIVRVFDPVLHDELPVEGQSDSLDHGPRLDRRFVRCRRPLVTVGGELTLDALDLAYGKNSGFYRAPVQVAANGGVLVIDDFGRQKCSPQELLNRWIGPLETRVDYLVLQSGQRIEVPFQVLVVFATNIRPGELVDEAFLRRIHFKIFAESPTVTDYLHIFERYCETSGIDFDPALVEDVLQSYYHPRQLPLRGCHPRDLIDQALSMADYLGYPRALTRELLRAACFTYFVDDREPLTEYV